MLAPDWRAHSVSAGDNHAIVPRSNSSESHIRSSPYTRRQADMCHMVMWLGQLMEKNLEEGLNINLAVLAKSATGIGADASSAPATW
jgi:hypothetical protein